MAKHLIPSHKNFNPQSIPIPQPKTCRHPSMESEALTWHTAALTGINHNIIRDDIGKHPGQNRSWPVMKRCFLPHCKGVERALIGPNAIIALSTPFQPPYNALKTIVSLPFLNRFPTASYSAYLYAGAPTVSWLVPACLEPSIINKVAGNPDRTPQNPTTGYTKEILNRILS